MTDNSLLLLKVEAQDKATAVFEAMEGKISALAGGLGTLQTALGKGGTATDVAAAKVAALGRAHEAATAQVNQAQSEMVSAAAKVESAHQQMSAAAKLSGDEQVKATAAAQIALDAATSEERASLEKLKKANSDAAQSHKELSDAQDEASAKGKAFTKVAQGVGIASGAIAIGVGIAAVQALKAAGNFQESMTALVTGAGESKDNIDQVSSGILQLARDTGTSSDQLASGMYMIESAGYHGAAGLDVLKAAAEGAKVGNADLGTVANAVTSAMKVYGPSMGNANQVTSQLVATVANGKMHMQDLAGSLSAILPVAANAGISYAQVGGALATMTATGMSAQQASQDLANTIRSLQSPSSVATGEMEQLGLSSVDVSKNLGQRGLTGTIKLLSDAVASHMGPAGLVIQNAFNQSQAAAQDAQTMLEKLPPATRKAAQAFLDGSITTLEWRKTLKGMTPEQANLAAQFATVADKAHGFNNLLKSGNPQAQTFAAAMGKMLGGATGLNVGLMLTGKNAATFNENVQKISDSATESKDDVKGWDEVQKDFNTTLDRAGQTFETMKIAIGSAFLPILTNVLNTVIKFLGPISDWITKNKTFAATILIVVGALSGIVATLIGVGLAVKVAKDAFGALNLTMKALAMGSVWGILLTVVVTVVILIITHWQQVQQVIGAVWSWVQQVIGAFVSWFMSIWNPVAAWFISVWRAVSAGFMAVWNPLVGFLTAVWEVIVNVLKVAVMIILTVVITPFILIIHALADVFTWLWQSVISPVWNGIVDVLRTAWNWIYSNVIQPIIDYVKLVASTYVWLWQNVLVPVWNGIVSVFQTAWNWIYSNVIQIIIDYVHILGSEFNWFWQNVIIPVWNGIQSAISVVWNWLYQNVVQAIIAYIHELGNEWNWFWHNIIEPVWQGIQNAISTVWNWLTQNIFDPIGQVVKSTGDGFNSMGKIIGDAWNSIMNMAKVPVKFVIDTVYNNGIREVWNFLAGAFGGQQLAPVPLTFAKGGVIPGYEPGRDTVHALLSKGEGILIPQAVKALGGASGIAAINSMFASGSGRTMNLDGTMAYGGGGVVGDILGAIGGAIGNALNGLKNAVLGGLSAAATPVIHGIYGLADSTLGHAGMGGLVDSGVHTAGDAILKFLSGKDSTAAASIGGASVGGNVMSWIAQAMSIAGVSGDVWTNGLSQIIAHESGGNPNAVNNWDSNALAGHPSKGLMQEIQSTFEAYRSMRLPDDIFDPIANIVAGIGYINARYGGIANVPGIRSMANGGAYVGYDSGGYLEPGFTPVWNGTGRREIVSPAGAGQMGGGIYIDLRGAQVMSDRDMDILIDKLGYTLATKVLPNAGVTIRR